MKNGFGLQKFLWVAICAAGFVLLTRNSFADDPHSAFRFLGFGWGNGYHSKSCNSYRTSRFPHQAQCGCSLGKAWALTDRYSTPTPFNCKVCPNQNYFGQQFGIGSSHPNGSSIGLANPYISGVPLDPNGCGCSSNRQSPRALAAPIPMPNHTSHPGQNIFPGQTQIPQNQPAKRLERPISQSLPTIPMFDTDVSKQSAPVETGKTESNEAGEGSEPEDSINSIQNPFGPEPNPTLPDVGSQKQKTLNAIPIHFADRRNIDITPDQQQPNSALGSPVPLAPIANPSFQQSQWQGTTTQKHAPPIQQLPVESSRSAVRNQGYRSMPPAQPQRFQRPARPNFILRNDFRGIR